MLALSILVHSFLFYFIFSFIFLGAYLARLGPWPWLCWRIRLGRRLLEETADRVSLALVLDSEKCRMFIALIPGFLVSWTVCFALYWFPLAAVHELCGVGCSLGLGSGFFLGFVRYFVWKLFLYDDFPDLNPCPWSEGWGWSLMWKPGHFRCMDGASCLGFC